MSDDENAIVSAANDDDEIEEEPDQEQANAEPNEIAQRSTSTTRNVINATNTWLTSA